MARTRVDELAQLLGVESKKVLDILSGMGSESRDHTTILGDREARAVRDAITREALIKQRQAMQQRSPQTGAQAATVQRAKPVRPASDVPKARVVAPGEAAPAAAAPAAKRAPGPLPERVRAKPAPPPATIESEATPAAPQSAVAASESARPAARAVASIPEAGRAGSAPTGAAAPGPAVASAEGRPAPSSALRPPRPTAGGVPRPAGPRPAASGAPRPSSRPAPAGAPRPAAGGGAPRPAAGGGAPRPGGPARPGGAPRPGGAGRPRPGGAARGPARPGAGATRRPSRSSRRSRDRSRGPELELRRTRVTQITLDGPISVRDLAEQMGVTLGEAIKQLMAMGTMATVNQVLDLDVARRLAAELGTEVQRADDDEAEEAPAAKAAETPDRSSKFMRTRPPVITVMGHVDHGKTTLLDAIRKSNVAAHEAGGITQHIGASVVNWQGNRLVFIDTPGHEAFTAMRARGAQVTDVVILVVAADDGVKPQTIEAVNHIKAAKVPMIVAVNKIDRPGSDVDRVKRQLSEQGVVAEDWGGDTVFVNVSALKGEGINTLLEMIILVTEMQELKANPLRSARGTVIEAKLDRGRGPVATVLVQAGTLRVGDVIVAGTTFGRVRALFDELGERVEQAGPSQPVEILGLPDVPLAGESFEVAEDDRVARELVTKAGEDRKSDQSVRGMVSLEDLYHKLKTGTIKELNLVVKADVQGSLEALQSTLNALTLEEVRLQVIHGGVGPVTETDVMLAATSDAIIIGFNVRPDTNARRVAQREQVDIRTYQIIYEVLDDINAAAKGLLEPKMQKVQIGKAQVRATFSVPRVGVIAGSYVLDGRITRNSEVRVVRDGKLLHEGKISSLKRFKDDTREVQAGFECGIGVDGFEKFEEGDIIEAWITERVERAS